MFHFSTCFLACDATINYRNEKQFISYVVYEVYDLSDERPV